MENIVYGLESPIDGKVYYVGQSQKGLSRPYSHKNSHNKDVREWVRNLENEPVVRILERDIDIELLLSRETFWINEMKRRGEPLFNKSIPTERELRYRDYELGRFLKEKRKEVHLSQVEFAEKAGVALTVVRKVEQGHKNLNLDKLEQLLKMFGATLIPIVK